MTKKNVKIETSKTSKTPKGEPKLTFKERLERAYHAGKSAGYNTAADRAVKAEMENHILERQLKDTEETVKLYRTMMQPRERLLGIVGDIMVNPSIMSYVKDLHVHSHVTKGENGCETFNITVKMMKQPKR